MSYHATDDDLPANMWPGRDMERTASYEDDMAVRSIAVQLHYPEIKLTRKQQRDLNRDRNESQRSPLQDRKQYVKIGKKLQMWDWLRDLEATFPAMDDGERRFCTETLARFRRYTPYGVKWITFKQWNWCKTIAARYIALPR